MTVLICGVGKIGLGCIAELFSKKPHDIILCSHSEKPKITKMLLDTKKFTHINRDTQEKKPITFKDYFICSNSEDKPKLDELIASPELNFITTSVRPENLESWANLISTGIKKRLENGINSPLFILPFENLSQNGKKIEHYICSKIDDANKEKMNNANIYFINVVVDRICHEPKILDIDLGLIGVTVEDYSELILDISNIRAHHIQELIENIPSGVVFVDKPLIFQAYEDRKKLLINTVHLAIASIAYKYGIIKLSEAMNNNTMIEFTILDVQSELREAFKIKYGHLTKEHPFDDSSLIGYCNKFIYRVKQNTEDETNRIMKDLINFQNIGIYSVPDFFKLANSCKDKQTTDSPPQIYCPLNEVKTRISSESAFFSKLEKRILDPIISLQVTKAKNLGLILITILQSVNTITESMNKNITAELSKPQKIELKT